jgi:excisionase family DNA binding protein
MAGAAMAQVVTLVSWAFAPDWLTIEEASTLSGHDADTLRRLIEDGALDARRNGDGWLIEKAALREFQEARLAARR